MYALCRGHPSPSLPEQDDPTSFPATRHLAGLDFVEDAKERLNIALRPEVITLVLWKLSVEEDGQLWFTPLAFLGAGCVQVWMFGG